MICNSMLMDIVNKIYECASDGDVSISDVIYELRKEMDV